MSAAGVTVADRSCAIWPKSRGLDLELLAGAGGLDRRITNPHPQKTGLALSGFDAYLREGRVLVFGESEVRFLEALDPGRARPRRCASVFCHAHPVPARDRRLRCRRRKCSIEADRAHVPLLRTRAATPLRDGAGSRPRSTSISPRTRSCTAC